MPSRTLAALHDIGHRAGRERVDRPERRDAERERSRVGAEPGAKALGLQRPAQDTEQRNRRQRVERDLTA